MGRSEEYERGRRLLETGDEAFQDQRLAAAEKAYLDAAKLFSQIGNEEGRAAALTNLGATLAKARRLEDAIAILHEAIALHQKTRVLSGLAMATFSLAMTLADAARFFAALEAFENAHIFLREGHQGQLADQAADYAKTLRESLPKNVPDGGQSEWDDRSARLVSAKAAGVRQYQTGDPVGALRFWNIALLEATHLRYEHEAVELLNSIASAKCRLGRISEGCEDFSRAAELAQQLGFAKYEATILNNLGCAWLDFGEQHLALDCLRRSVSMRSALGDTAEHAESQANLGVAYARNGDRAEALACLNDSCVLYQSAGNLQAVNSLAQLIPRVEAGDRLLERRVYGDFAESIPQTNQDFARDLQEAQDAERRGDFTEATRLYEGLLRSRLYDSGSVHADLLIRLGFSYNRIGRRGMALLCYQAAAEHARNARDQEREARALNNAGVLSTDPDVSLDLLRRAAALRERLSDPHELGETYVSIAQSVPMGDAAGYMKQAIKLLDPGRNGSAWAAAYRSLIDILQGDELVAFRTRHRPTAESIGLALDLDKGIGSGPSREELEKLHALVDLDELGHFGLILEAPATRDRTPEYQWRSTFTKALVAWDIGNRNAAIEAMCEVLEAIEATRVALLSRRERSEYFQKQWHAYDKTIEYLLAESRVEEALEVVERAKARSLLDLLANIDYLPEAIPVEQREAFRRAILALNDTERDLEDRTRQGFGRDSSGLSAAQVRWISTKATAAQILDEITKRIPGFDPNKPVPTVDRGSMNVLLRTPRHLIIVWWLGTSVRGAFLLSREGLKFEHLTESEELSKALMTDRKSTDIRSSQRDLGLFPQTAELSHDTLSHILLAPLERHLDQSKVSSVTIVPHHYLHLLAFHTLSFRGSRLLDLYTIDYCPSLSLLQLCTRRIQHMHDALLGASALIVGNPDGSLQAAGIEAEQLGAILESSLVLRESEATAAAVISNMNSRTFLHFACHGRSGERQEEDFALLLAPTLNHTGMLSAGQIISQITLMPGSLVVLSACSTAKVALGETDEYVGLVGAFLLAGASTVVASLWPVDDVSTALLIWKFYKNVLSGDDVSTSLRTAQRWLRSLDADEIILILQKWKGADKDAAAQADYDALILRFRQRHGKPFEDPFFWGAFICIGDSRPRAGASRQAATQI